MSSLRNATKRRTHAERAQPSARRKLGLLEKKSDYKERAANFRKRTESLKVLQKKAALRNPDEFYKAMAKPKDGRPESSLKHSEVVRLKDQDFRFATMKKVVADRKLDKMKSSLHGTLEPSENERVLWDHDDVVVEKVGNVKGVQKRMRRAYAQLEKAREEKESRTRALEKLDAERKVMTSKGRKRKLSEGVFKWKKERKK